MKAFKLDSSGDVVINDNKIEYVSGVELVAQTLRQVLNTNLGEWFGNEDEGIDFSVVLTKNPNYELIQDTIDTAVQYVADMLGVELEADNYSYSTDGRQLTVTMDITYTDGDETETAELELAL